MHPFFLTFALVAALPREAVPSDVVEVIEKNHYATGGDADGVPHLQTQWVLWELDADGRERVVAWQLVKKGDYVRRTSDGWRLHCMNQWGGFRRRIEAVSFRETYTNFDVEVVDREKHAAHQRRGLTQPRGRQPPHYATP